ncbi:hypothetical protein PIB30_097851 [Stylosanthes scabra]|uniref:Uncharacterized protein n=1 Tax=Stylosanthes scabra TaxID=79078 RepID=A0ABU6QXU3_9FABA|nr:hypothetical protein [Stylosanthes scabra]
METTPRIWRRHDGGSSLMDDGRQDTEWETTKATSRRAMEVAMTNSICSEGDFGSFCLQKGQWGGRITAGVMGEKFGLGVLGFTGSKRNEEGRAASWLSVSVTGGFWGGKFRRDIVSVTYQGRNAEQRDTTDILFQLFSKNNLAPKSLLGNPEEARRVIVEMAVSDVTLTRLRNLLQPAPPRAVPTTSGPSPAGRVLASPVASAAGTRATPERGSSSDVGRTLDQLVDILLPRREHEPLPSPISSKKGSAGDSLIGAKRPRIFEGSSHEFSMMDCSFDASDFVENNLLGPRWAMLRSASIMKSIEPRLTMS